jgi:hypothetical protein
MPAIRQAILDLFAGEPTWRFPLCEKAANKGVVNNLPK